VDRAAAGSHINRGMDIRQIEGLTEEIPQPSAYQGAIVLGADGLASRRNRAAIDTGEAARNLWTGDLGRVREPRDR
jgi:hypothetical protein